MGVEPINDGIARRSPVLKTGTITGPHALPFCSLPIRCGALPNVSETYVI
jgi:hypothetical protein